MTTGARLDGPMSREQTIADARELVADGSPIGEAARRFGMAADDLGRWLKSEHENENRQARKT